MNFANALDESARNALLAMAKEYIALTGLPDLTIEETEDGVEVKGFDKSVEFGVNQPPNPIARRTLLANEDYLMQVALNNFYATD